MLNRAARLEELGLGGAPAERLRVANRPLDSRDDLGERLQRAQLEKIADREAINEQHRSIWRAMQASVDMLPAPEQRRFAELSVFATDQTATRYSPAKCPRRQRPRWMRSTLRTYWLN